MTRIAVDYLEARGHVNIRGQHRSTIEITKERELTARGDCIIGVSSTKGASELNEELKGILRNEGSILIVLLITEKFHDYLVCRGSSKLQLTDSNKIIVRKSQYVNESTLCLESDKSAAELSRNLIDELKEGSRLRVFLIGLSDEDLGSPL